MNPYENFTTFSFLVGLFLCLPGAVFGSVPSHGLPALPHGQHVTATMLEMPIQFEANHGQTDNQVQFLSRGKGFTLFLTPTESVMVIQQRETKTQADEGGMGSTEIQEPIPSKQTVVRMKLKGANLSPSIEGKDQLPGVVNYFMGKDPTKWQTNIPTYAKVYYTNAYPGIDLAYYGNQGRLEYDFIVAPNGDPNQIKLAFEGASKIQLSEKGDLLLSTDTGEVRLQKPVVYQVADNGHKKFVAADFVFHPDYSLEQVSSPNFQIAFQLAEYDKSKELVIDPVLVYSSYLGGSASDVGFDIAVDAIGQAYVTGRTLSVNFPTASPIQGSVGGDADVFVTKMNASGSAMLYSTYLGGSTSDQGEGIAVNDDGEAFITGRTFSTDFPTANPLQGISGGSFDAFVVRLTDTGSGLVYSTYIGGSGSDEGKSIVVDQNDQVYVTGVAATGFPLVNPFQNIAGGLQDLFVTKLNAAGSSLVYSSFLGGSGRDFGDDIAIDAQGQAYVTGRTNSTDFPTVSPYQAANGGGLNDAILSKINALGTGLVYSTYLGGAGDDRASSLAVDSTEQVYLTGETDSLNFPTATPFQAVHSGEEDIFVTKFNATASALVYSTYLGGSLRDIGLGIALDSVGQAYIAGLTLSANYPTVSPIQATHGGSQDVIVTKFHSTGTSLIYSTFLGGGGNDRSRGLALDNLGQAYITGSASTQFPTVSAFQSSSGGGLDDGFVAKLSDALLANAGPDQTVNEGTGVQLDGTGSFHPQGQPLNYSWAQVAGPIVVLTNPTSATPTFTAPSVTTNQVLTFSLVVDDGTDLSSPDVVNITVVDLNNPPLADAGDDSTVKPGAVAMLDGTNSFDPDGDPITFQWTQVSGTPVVLSDLTASQPTFTGPNAIGDVLIFKLQVFDGQAFSSLSPGADSLESDTVAITIVDNSQPVADAGSDQTKDEGSVVTLNGTGSFDPDGGDVLSFQWVQTGGPMVTLSPTNSPTPMFTAPFVGLGGADLTFSLVVTDNDPINPLSSVADEVIIHIANINDPPNCAAARPSLELGWPPNGLMEMVEIKNLADPENDAITIQITSITQDEPVSGSNGDSSPDGVIQQGNPIDTLLLRIQRDGQGNGRVYQITFTASDGVESCQGAVEVPVPHDRKDTAVNDGQIYDSTQP